MRRSSEPQERAQFTVAELLARYGDSAPAAGRRHRRAADDSDGVAATAAEPSAARHPAQPAVRGAAQPAVERNWAGNPELTQPHLDAAHLSAPHLNGPARQRWAPAVGPPSVAAPRVPVAPPPLPRRAPLPSTTPSDGPVTEQLPRLDRVPVNPTTWSNGGPASAGPGPRADPDISQPPAGLRAASRASAEPPEDALATDDGEAQQAGSPLWEWAVMVSQVGIGVVGGAALWLICEWLWQRIPVVALVVALAVITGLVWVVRRVRRAEDLQTTVVAVLVGLFVTVSPAALLLVGR
jgi:hypothetical protein